MNGNLVAALSPGFSSSALGKIAIILTGTLLLTISATVQVPFWPVPMTMQTFVVLVIAMACGPVIGGSVVLAYLAEGALGLPVFAGTPERGIGLAYMMGPTGGYLLGMLVAAVACGQLAARGWDRSVWMTMLAMLIGTVIIMAFGYAWLAVSIGPYKAWAFGVVPFLLSGVVKIVLGALVLPAGWALLGRGKA